jgi:O-acetyl-ADP-ribose deacetylase (regulator of RNase III)
VVKGSDVTEIEIAGCRLTLAHGDITTVAVDAIVNAANHSLLGGGGVDGAIHRRGGPEILAACRDIRAREWPDGLPTGHAVITPGGRLPARFVIHTVGPVYSRKPEIPTLLAACHSSSLALAREHGLRTVAFPAISTGIYGYPLDEAAPIALATIARELAAHPGTVAEVRFVLFDAPALAAFGNALAAIPAPSRTS